MQSRIKQCKRCKRVFQSVGAAFCPECVIEMEEEFDKVRKYLYEHSNANVFEIVQETGVKERTVLSFLKEGRLSIKNNQGFLTCERCGVSIESGRFCKKCENDIGGQFEANIAENKQRALEDAIERRTQGMHREYKND